MKLPNQLDVLVRNLDVSTQWPEVLLVVANEYFYDGHIAVISITEKSAGAWTVYCDNLDDYTNRGHIKALLKIQLLEDVVKKQEEVKAEYIELQEHSKQRECAAGPWIDGPPQEDGMVYLAIFTGRKDAELVRWNSGFCAWLTTSDQYRIYGNPIMHAKINMPEELEKMKEKA